MTSYILIKAPAIYKELAKRFVYDRRVLRVNVVENTEKGFPKFDYDLVLEVDARQGNLLTFLAQVREIDGVDEAFSLLFCRTESAS